MSRRVLRIIVAAWCGCVAAGSWAMLKYEFTPAAAPSATADWPAGSSIERDPNRPTLVMFLHPRCPCSRATLNELNRLATECPDRFALDILFIRPTGFSEDWERTDLYESARRIPGAHVLCDPGGVEAARFGATTSGETLLYSPAGRLLFQGGMTASRGHEGDNTGRAALADLIETGRAETRRTAVFGCALTNPAPTIRQGVATRCDR